MRLSIMSETITAIQMAKKADIDQKEFRAALRRSQFPWHALNAPWTVQRNSSEHQDMHRVLRTLFHSDRKPLLEAFQDQANKTPDLAFNPDDVEDGRRRLFAAVIRRQGQQTFRRALLKAYDTKCAMTASQASWVLEAAHITPYMGTKTNALTNGLLLRADIHTLFDLGLIPIDPGVRTIKVSKLLSDSEYTHLDGKRLAEPIPANARPSAAALKAHYAHFRA